MTPERKKEFKVYAIIAVILLAITGFRLGIHDMYQQAIHTGTTPPWTSGGEAEWKRNFELALQREFPSGTDLSTLKSKMQEDGYRSECRRTKSDGQSLKAICLSKNLYAGHTGPREDVEVKVFYDDQNKLIKMTVDYQLSVMYRN